MKIAGPNLTTRQGQSKLDSGANGALMTSSLQEVLSHIQDERDRHVLSALVKKHDVLRVRLLAPPVTLSSANCEAERAELNALKERLKSLQSTSAANERQIVRWTEWYKRNKDMNTNLIAENERLQSRITGLERELKKVVQEWKPPSTLLFQTA